MYLVGCGVIGLAVAGLDIWLREMRGFSLPSALVLDCVGGCVGLLIWHFYIWKTDTLHEIRAA